MHRRTTFRRGQNRIFLEMTGNVQGWKFLSQLPAVISTASEKSLVFARIWPGQVGRCLGSARHDKCWLVLCSDDNIFGNLYVSIDLNFGNRNHSLLSFRAPARNLWSSPGLALRKLEDVSAPLLMIQVPRTEESARHWACRATPLHIGRVGAVLELPSANDGCVIFSSNTAAGVDALDMTIRRWSGMARLINDHH